MQNRIGPNRAGPFGHPPDARRRHQGSSSRRTCSPTRADRKVFRSRRSCRWSRRSSTFSIDPDRRRLLRRQRAASSRSSATTRFLQLADPPIGILLVLAMSSIAVYGVMLAGWSSGSKYPLLGSVRASAQMVSYEAALGLSVVAVVLVTGTLSTHGIVTSQATLELEPLGHRLRAVRDLPHRRHRRAQPAAVRPRRGRAGAGRRLPHRVLVDPLRRSSSWPSS